MGMSSFWRLFVLSFFPRDILDVIWDLIESVSEGFPTYSNYETITFVVFIFAQYLSVLSSYANVDTL